MKKYYIEIQPMIRPNDEEDRILTLTKFKGKSNNTYYLLSKCKRYINSLNDYIRIDFIIVTFKKNNCPYKFHIYHTINGLLKGITDFLTNED